MKQVTEIVYLSKPCEQKSLKNEPPEEDQEHENNKISIHYLHTGEIWNTNKNVVDNIFSYKVVINITKSNDNDYEPQTIDEC